MTKFHDEYLLAGTDYQTAPVVVLDEENDALRHFITHMNESLAQSLKIESERAQMEFSHNTQQIIDRHAKDINDYINANIQSIIKSK